MFERTLVNGNKIPTLGFGTDYVPKGDTAFNSVVWAIEAGYRHIDNADCYDNQKEVGLAIKDCIDRGLVKREDLFIVSKVPDWKQGYESTIECCKNSLKEMGLEYFDLYLVHSPLRSRTDWETVVLETYRALEYLYEQGLIKNIGVANFNRKHIMHLRKNVKILPVVNQIEVHPEHQQLEVRDVCEKSYIQIIAWGALNQGRIFKNKVFLDLAQKYNVSPSQIAVRWSVQKGYCPLARSVKKEHIETNFKVMDFELSQEDMKLLDSLDGGEFSNTHHDGLIPTFNNSGASAYNPDKYVRIYKLFGIIPFLIEKRERWNKTKWFLFGIPILKITKKEIR